MEIEVRIIAGGEYAEVTVKDEATITTGLLDRDDRKELALEFIRAADFLIDH